MLSESKKYRLDTAKEILNKNGVVYEEKSNGQLNIDKISFWATTGKWYDPGTGEKGNGINSLLTYLRKNLVITAVEKDSNLFEEAEDISSFESFIDHIKEFEYDKCSEKELSKILVSFNEAKSLILGILTGRMM